MNKVQLYEKPSEKGAVELFLVPDAGDAAYRVLKSGATFKDDAVAVMAGNIEGRALEEIKPREQWNKDSTSGGGWVRRGECLIAIYACGQVKLCVRRCELSGMALGYLGEGFYAVESLNGTET